MPINTAAPIATQRGLTATFDTAVNAATPFYPEVCNIMPSEGADEKYSFLGAMPQMREWLGDRVFQTLSGAEYTLKNRDWEGSVSIQRKDYEDDRVGQYGIPLADLGDQAAKHPDKLLMELVIAAGGLPCFDGQYFYDTDHAWGDSGTQSNDITGAAADANAVTPDEFAAAYHKARSAMLNFKRDNGEPWVDNVIRPMPSLLLVVPTKLEYAATKGLTAQYGTGGADNVVLDRPKIVASPRLTNGAQFHLWNLSQRLKPFMFQARQPIKRQMKGLDDREHKDIKFMADARYNMGFGAWWNAIRVTLQPGG